ncbi:MAG: hypothetical protein V1922_00325 [bacterium]
MLRVFGPVIGFIKKACLVVGVFSIIFVIFGSVFKNNRPKINDKAILAARQKEMYKALDDQKLNSTKTGKIALVIYRFTYCSLIGELCTDKPVAGTSNFNSSLLGKVSSLITLPYLYPPASGTYWIASTLQKAGFIPSSYAAEGIGFTSIKPLMNLWTIFRDAAYLLIVLVLVAIGFMIMFRMKLNPQTVISVENSLPKIVVALLLITFSFAIAGFLIDIMYLLVLFSISILSSGDKFYNTVAVQNELLNSGIATIWKYILPIKVGNIPLAREVYLGDALASILPSEITGLIQIIAGFAFPIVGSIQLLHLSQSNGTTEVLNNLTILGNGAGSIPKFVIGSILTIFIYIALLGVALNGLGFFFGIIVILTLTALLFKIFFMLFRSYLQIIITIVFAPIILLFEAVPGKSTFSYWIKSLIGELITFPIVITMMLVGKVMISTLSYPGDYWKAPFIGNFSTEGFGVLFGAGLIFITPDIVKFAKDALGVKPLPFNIGVGTFLGGAGAVTGGGMGILQQFSTLSLGLTGISNLTGMVRGKKPAAIDPNQVAADQAAEAARIHGESQRPAAPMSTGGISS